MKIILQFLLLLISTLTFANPPKGYVMVWRDEFDGNKLDETKWSYIWKGETRRAAKYVPEAIKVEDGKLKIATYTADYQTYSGAISTKDKFEYSYGYYEIRAKFNDKSGTWSDAWLYSDTVTTMRADTYDLRNSGAEIDIFEHFLHNNYGENTNNQVQHTIHWNKYGEENSEMRQVTGEYHYTDNWHVFGLEWTPTSYKFYVDGQLSWECKGGVTSRPEYIILSTEVEDMNGAGPLEPPYSDITMEIEYIRVYAR